MARGADHAGLGMLEISPMPFFDWYLSRRETGNSGTGLANSIPAGLKKRTATCTVRIGTQGGR